VLSHQGERGGYSRFSERLEDMVKRPLSFGKRLFRGDGRSKIGDGGADGSPSSNSHLPSAASREEFWALKDVSFEVKRGEVVGIIGRNGAGKSTLLKILSRITEPSEGRVTLRGRVASLLEVGTGFHPELTGRENIFLNGAILGMSKAEIRKKFAEIVAFAEVERFLDTPVKRYSSGMYVRLAFAVAAHLEPEILVVDEVLAVGDAEFQKKCLGKMKDVATGGRTVLFVSHNLMAVRMLCSRSILLQKGNLVTLGETEPVLAAYAKLLKKSSEGNGQTDAALVINPFVRVKGFAVSPGSLVFGGAGSICFEIESRQPEVVSEMALLIYNSLGMRCAIVDLRQKKGPLRISPGKPGKVRVEVRDLRLIEGEYEVSLHYRSQTSTHYGLRLGTFLMEPKKPEDGMVPYAPEHRGAVELNLSVSLSG